MMVSMSILCAIIQEGDRQVGVVQVVVVRITVVAVRNPPVVCVVARTRPDVGVRGPLPYS